MRTLLKRSFLVGLIVVVFVLGFSSSQFESKTLKTITVSKTESSMRVLIWTEALNSPAYYDYSTRTVVLKSTFLATSGVEFGEDRERIMTLMTIVPYSTSVTKVLTRTVNGFEYTLIDQSIRVSTTVVGKPSFAWMPFLLTGLALLILTTSAVHILIIYSEKLKSKES